MIRKGVLHVLKKILLDLSPAIEEMQSVQAFLQGLKRVAPECVFFPAKGPFSSAAVVTANRVTTSSPKPAPSDCLVITDTASGVLSAQTAKLPCIGYAPPGYCEDLSGAYALFEDFSSIDMGYLRRTHAHAMGYPAEILTTDRLTVRELSEKDFPKLYVMCTAPETAPFMDEKLSDYETELEKHKAYLRNVYPFFDLALWGVFETASGMLIGRAGFSLPEDETEFFSLGYLIDVPYRRNGYAKELIPALLTYAKEQGYSKISAKIKQDNVSSQRTLAGCGFPYACKEDTVHGILIYTIDLTM